MNTTRRRSVIIVGLLTLIALAIFGFTLVHAVLYAPDGDVVPVPLAATGTEPVTASSTPEAHPARLEIPALSIDAAVQNVGINGKGNMSAPSNFTDVGWYKYGTVPGERGSAVMAGHVDNGLALAGVFKHLDNIKSGDDIYVITNDGTRLHFVVSAVDSYQYQNAPAAAIFGQNDGSYLKLLTCTGSWVQGDKTYDHRLVVTAVLQG